MEERVYEEEGLTNAYSAPNKDKWKAQYFCSELASHRRICTKYNKLHFCICKIKNLPAISTTREPPYAGINIIILGNNQNFPLFYTRP